MMKGIRSMWTQFLYISLDTASSYDPYEVWIEMPQGIAIELFKIILLRDPKPDFYLTCDAYEWNIFERDKLEPESDSAFIFHLRHITQFRDILYDRCKTNDERLRINALLS